MSSEKKSRAYHHGALKAALLTAAEHILDREGVPGLTLRAVAREVGVSHAAPRNHFADLTALLSELAAVGYARFNDVLLAADERVPPGPQAVRERLIARGRAYVEFAVANRGLFQLMFRTERLDLQHAGLRAEMNRAAGLLAQAGAAMQESAARRLAAAGKNGAVAQEGAAEGNQKTGQKQAAGQQQLVGRKQVAGQGIGAVPPTLEEAARMASGWSEVHGFSMLLLDGALDGLLRELPAGTTAAQLLEAMLRLP